MSCLCGRNETCRYCDPTIKDATYRLQVDRDNWKARALEAERACAEWKASDASMRTLLASESNRVEFIQDEARETIASLRAELTETKKVLEEVSLTLSRLRPKMRLPEMSDWDELEIMHNRISSVIATLSTKKD